MICILWIYCTCNLLNWLYLWLYTFHLRKLLLHTSSDNSAPLFFLLLWLYLYVKHMLFHTYHLLRSFIFFIFPLWLFEKLLNTFIFTDSFTVINLFKPFKIRSSFKLSYFISIRIYPIVSTSIVILLLFMHIVHFLDF